MEPTILTANTFFWKPCPSASGRRRNEAARLSEVAKFFRSIGLDVDVDSDRVTGSCGELVVRFDYSETCTTVYKSLEVTNDGKKSNITRLRKLYK